MATAVKKYEIKVTADSPLRVGGPRDPIRGVDLPMASIAGKPVIPGPSLKGALRANLEQYLVALGKSKPSLKPCIPASKPSRAEEGLSQSGSYRVGGGCSAETGDGAVDGATATICPACYLLGAQGLVGFVSLPTLVGSMSQEELVGIAIDRSQGTVRGGANWRYEFAKTGSTFVGPMEVLLEDPARGWVLGEPRLGFGRQDAWLTEDLGWTQSRVLQELLIDRIESITVLGGFKSKGFGRVKITVKPLG